MKKKSGLLARFMLAFASIWLVSCDKDFNSLGADLVNDDFMDVAVYSNTSGIESGYLKTGAVATNKLALNNLGAFTHPTLGNSEYHFVTQLALDQYSPDLGQEPTIDSVYMYVPYFSKLASTETSGRRIYTLDSIKGTGTFDLKVYENNYYLSSIDPNATDGVRRYYSNDKPNFDSNKGAVLNTSTNLVQNAQFKFDNSEIALFKRNENGELLNSEGNVISESAPYDQKVVLERFEPGMWLDLDKTYFQNKIFNTNSSNLSSFQSFSNYFRGLYFNVTQDPANQGALATLDFSKGYIQINYSYKNENGDVFKNTLKMTFTGETVSLIENQYTNLPQTSTDKLLVVGGGKGSGATSTDGYITYIDLFGKDAGNGIPEQIDILTNYNWLINEANVTIYVDQDFIGADPKYVPQRLFLYDLNNSSVLVDYSNDTSSNTSDPKKNKGVYSGLLVKSDDNGYYYKFRITEYVKGLIKSQTPMLDAKNKYRLGLSVTEAISLATFTPLLNELAPLTVKQIPTGSVISPLGTVLHGANTAQTDKKIKFEVYYTNPN
ncbi:DUF4270 domain-containing protein [Flavobacterium agricola]|uniref:DUF4270 domain-containing protein n=1 Tax=Flavobacterium agricola TaxID=2870839 RepID=A0ABY6M179_9FLAO|nr:DUF4270 domain-containing protein [Flavobacterium agricola]UYW01165.1 DUF4270 domain-containing protein [Flavobacterium agricola]